MPRGMLRVSCFGCTGMASVRQATCPSFRQAVCYFLHRAQICFMAFETWDAASVGQTSRPSFRQAACYFLRLAQICSGYFKFEMRHLSDRQAVHISDRPSVISCVSRKFVRGVSDLRCGICQTDKPSVFQASCQNFCCSEQSKESPAYQSCGISMICGRGGSSSPPLPFLDCA